MKLFGRTGGYYLFWTGFVYFWVGMYLAFTHAARPEIATTVWVCILALPFAVPPVGRYFNLDVEWDRKMFDWFKSREERKAEYANVVPFPELKSVAPVEPPAPKEKEPEIHYTIGHTSDNRIAFRLGHTTLTMNYIGVQQLIEQLELYQSQLSTSDSKDEV
jgi:hypothetical protein